MPLSSANTKLRSLRLYSEVYDQLLEGKNCARVKFSEYEKITNLLQKEFGEREGSTDELFKVALRKVKNRGSIPDMNGQYAFSRSILIAILTSSIILGLEFYQITEKWKSDQNPEHIHDERFSQYRRLAPKGAADYAFLTHMLYHLAQNGTMAIVLPHRALFRGAAEGHIREYIIKNQNCLDAVIGLPPNLFFGTSIPATVMIFKKCRKNDEDILLIDASREFDKGKNQNRLTDENIEKIFETYQDRKEIERYSHKASMAEIVENEYNLNIPRYVDTFEEEEPIDIEAVACQLKALKSQEGDLQSKIASFCEELNIAKPF